MRRAHNPNAVTVYCTSCKWKGMRTDNNVGRRLPPQDFTLNRGCPRCRAPLTFHEVRRGEKPIPGKEDQVKRPTTLQENIRDAFKECVELRKEKQELLDALSDLYATCASDLPRCNNFSSFEKAKNVLLKHPPFEEKHE